MSPVDNTKPPRPCTEYNIFFQLERAYILQVVLDNNPILDATEIFHPSQPTYAGRPLLPQRYASLILPCDWHLPGKEQRRKRKHRKSHGAISFHDLSARIVNAWKVVDDQVKAYCSQVCAIGMLRYKAAMKEWKLKGGAHQKVAAQKNRRQMIAKMFSPSESVTKPLLIASHKISTVKKGCKTDNKQGMTKMAQNACIQDKVQGGELQIPAHVQSEALFGYNPRRTPKRPVQEVKFEATVQDGVSPIPAPVVSESVTIEEMDRAFENDILLGSAFVDLSDENALGTWDASKKQELLVLEPALVTFSTADIISSTALHYPSIISNQTVDMDDNEIISMWSQEHTSNSPSVPSIFTYNQTTIRDYMTKDDKQQYHVTSNATSGCTQNIHMQDIEKVRLMLEQQKHELEMVKRRTIVASSA